MEKVTAVVEFENKRVTFEGPEDFVRAEVERFTGLGRSLGSVRAPATMTEGGAVLSERELYLQKKPQGHAEIVAVLGYALTQAGQGEFGMEDIKKAYLRAGVRPPKVVDQALRDAKNKFDYIELGSNKGKYRLSTHGERTVIFDLPRDRKSPEQAL